MTGLLKIYVDDLTTSVVFELSDSCDQRLMKHYHSSLISNGVHTCVRPRGVTPHCVDCGQHAAVVGLK